MITSLSLLPSPPFLPPPSPCPCRPLSISPSPTLPSLPLPYPRPPSFHPRPPSLQRIVMSTPPPAPSTPSVNTSTQQQSPDPSNATPTPAPEATPITGPLSASNSDSNKQAKLDQVFHPSPALSPPSLVVRQLQCPNEHRPFVLQDEFEKLVLKQCTSSRFKIRPAK